MCDSINNQPISASPEATLHHYVAELERTLMLQNEQLKRAEVRFEQLLNSAPDAVIIVDAQGCIVLVNRQVEVMFGYTREEMLGQPIEMLMPERFRGAHLSYRERYTSAPRVRPMGVGMELIGMRKDGSEFPIEVSLSPMETEQGLQVVSIIRDITERKQAIEEQTRLQEKIIEMQAMALRELSTPLIPITDQVLVMPLIGAIDSRRAQHILDHLLEGVTEHRARAVIVDITGVPIIDTQVASVLLEAARAVRLLGARPVLTGIRPEVAQTLVGLGISFGEIETYSTLQAGIAHFVRCAN